MNKFVLVSKIKKVFYFFQIFYQNAVKTKTQNIAKILKLQILITV